jgi:hypothetical protein
VVHVRSYDPPVHPKWKRKWSFADRMSIGRWAGLVIPCRELQADLHVAYPSQPGGDRQKRSMLLDQEGCAAGLRSKTLQLDSQRRACKTSGPVSALPGLYGGYRHSQAHLRSSWIVRLRATPSSIAITVLHCPQEPAVLVVSSTRYRQMEVAAGCTAQPYRGCMPARAHPRAALPAG